MKNVEVLLREDVDKLGRVGDVVHVAPGYARNYLLPRSIAVAATPENKRLMARRRERLEAEMLLRAAEFEEHAKVLDAVVLRVQMRADEQGHLYGSVNAAKVAELLARVGHDLGERAVRLDTPIKEVGEHKVRVHLFREIHGEVTLVVEAEETA